MARDINNGNRDKGTTLLKRDKEKMTERVTPKEAKHIAELIRKVISVIEEPKYTYREVIYTLYEIIRNYEEKGHDLMENTSIQKVAEFGGLLS
ncbi:hypothetical protein [Otoolea muris]|uniref:hypothetical protein n=1 Tax=Otoolea muris TaxID=2941515 RepID=UPI00203ADB3B|nr:hypothetical protein [Otoolea muris]